MNGVAVTLMTIALVVALMVMPVPAQASTEGAVSPTVSTDVTDTSAADTTIAVRRDIPYMAPWSTEQTQKLDLYGLSGSQNSASSVARPLVVFIHGGAWINGDKSFMIERMPLVNTLLARGYLVASIDYRLATESPWPAQINDCKSAVRFLRANATKYGINPNRIAVFGESSGAHLAMMMGVTNGNQQFVDSQDGNGASVSSDVQAVISDFGIADVDAWGNLSGDNAALATNAKNLLFGVQEGAEYTAEQAEKASPINYVSASAAPMLLAHGQNDTMVSYHQTVMMQTALERVGATVDTWYPKNGPHASAEVFCTNIVAQRRYLDFLSTVFPARQASGSGQRMILVHRFYQPSDQVHMFSADANESVILDQDWTGWRSEGVAFQVISGSGDSETKRSASTQIIIGMRNTTTGDYVYTGNTEERESLVRAGWTEEASFRVPVTEGIPVYRFYNARNNRHTLVTSESEMTALLAQGWRNEGVAFCAYAASSEQ